MEKIKQIGRVICFYFVMPFFSAGMLIFLSFTFAGAFSPPEVVLDASVADIEETEILAEKIFPLPPVQGEVVNVSNEQEETALKPLTADMRSVYFTPLLYDYDIKNLTDYVYDVGDLLSRSNPYPYEQSDQPTVLVIHTHGTECYFDPLQYPKNEYEGEGDGFFSVTETPTRSNDPTRNVVRIGEVFCNTLNENGVGAVHCPTMHDAGGNYNIAYDLSWESTLEYIEKYPSIRYVIDIHRDSIADADGDKIAPTVTINDTEAAQIMIISGTDQNGANHPDWQSNLSFALKYKYKMEQLYPALTRPLMLHTSAFNQEVTRASFLLEIGTCASTLEQAENSARYAALALAQLIKEG